MTRFVHLGTELVHVATEGPLGWAAVTAANQLGLPSTSDFRTNFHHYSNYYGVGFMEPLIGGYLRRFHNRTQRCFSPTRENRRTLIASGFEHVEVVGRGVDLERFSPRRRDASLRASWGAGEGPVLLYVGRLAAEKNVELALQSYRAARALVPAARMVVVGDGPQRRRLQRQYPDVRFAGSKTGDALAAHYASADVFVFPSLSETFGNVTLEALASGLPVVAFDVAAACENVIDGVNGRTVAPGDEAAFTRAVCQVAMHVESLPSMRVAARRATTTLAWDSVLRRFENQLVDTAHGYRVARHAAACMA
jgi:glycosyltransferase involved in cell wall biosynthesis